MSPKVILFIAISLDGYIADKEGGVGWLDAFDLEGEDYGYHAMLNRLGAIVMGAATYRQVLTFGDWPYQGHATYVITRGQIEPANDLVFPAAGDVAALVAKIHAGHEGDIWLVGGAQINALFAQAGLIDEYLISVMPVLLGEGIPLFGAFAGNTDLALEAAETYPNGVVQLRYSR
jgi:dihydrofolate reductase